MIEKMVKRVKGWMVRDDKSSKGERGMNESKKVLRKYSA